MALNEAERKRLSDLKIFVLERVGTSELAAEHPLMKLLNHHPRLGPMIQEARKEQDAVYEHMWWLIRTLERELTTKGPQG